MNDELIEQINQIRYKLSDLVEDYKSIMDDISQTEQSKLNIHTTHLKKFSEELYQLFI